MACGAGSRRGGVGRWGSGLTRARVERGGLPAWRAVRMVRASWVAHAVRCSGVPALGQMTNASPQNGSLRRAGVAAGALSRVVRQFSRIPNDSGLLNAPVHY